MNTKKHYEKKAALLREVQKLRDNMKAEGRISFSKSEALNFDKLEDEIYQLDRTIQAFEGDQGEKAAGTVTIGRKNNREAYGRAYVEKMADIVAGRINGFETRAITTTTGASMMDARVGSPFMEELANDAFMRELTILDIKGAPSTAIPLIERGNYPSPAGRANETTAITESSLTFTSKTFTPKDIFALHRISNNLLRDGIDSTWQTIYTATQKSMVDEIARQVLYGDSGTDGEFDGIYNYTSIPTVAAGGALTSYAKIIEAYKTVMQKNVPKDNIKAVMSPAVWSQLAALVDSTGQPIAIPSQIADLPIIVSSQVSDNLGVSTNESQIFLGDWSSVWLGVSDNISVTLSERYADFDQRGLVSMMRSDLHVLDQERMCVITGITVA